jgi:hypothetical protein
LAEKSRAKTGVEARLGVEAQTGVEAKAGVDHMKMKGNVTGVMTMMMGKKQCMSTGGRRQKIRITIRMGMELRRPLVGLDEYGRLQNTFKKPRTRRCFFKG